MKIFFMSLTFLFICSHKIYSQDLNKKHSVKKGETVYRISKIYNTSVESIFALNPNSRDIIYVNDVLIIPNSNGKSTTTSNNGSIITVGNLKDIIYVVKKGETKYGLSKKYGITIAQLEQNNPHIIYGLQANHVLNIKGSKDNIIVQNINPTKYLVKKGDTKYGLSKNFNTTIDALESLNPEIVTMLRYDITINIPRSNNQENTIVLTEEVSRNNDDSNLIPEPKNEIIEEIKSEDLDVSINNRNESPNTYTNLRTTINSFKTRKILFVLPFTENEYEEYTSKIQSVDDSYLLQNIEFYKGAKTAIDSAKKLGLKFETDVFKLNHRNPEENELSIKSNLNALESNDGILIPFFKNETELISNSILNKNIPIVTFQASPTINIGSRIYEAIASKEIQKLKLIEYLKAKNGNIILISDINRDLNRNFLLEQAPNSSVVEVSERGEILKNDLTLALDKDKTNYVIIDSKRNSVFLNTTNLLLKELSDYAIQIAVMDSSLIPDSKNLSSKRFKVLNLIYPSINQHDNYLDTKKTNDDIFQLSYEITFDTLLRLSQSINFKASAIKDKTKYNLLSFNYKKGDSGSYRNDNVLIIEYNNIDSIKQQDD